LRARLASSAPRLLGELELALGELELELELANSANWLLSKV